MNIFTNYRKHERPRVLGGFECTGCAWSRDGTEICGKRRRKLFPRIESLFIFFFFFFYFEASMLSDSVYVFDVSRNFKKEFQLDYTPWRTRQKRRLRFLRKRQRELIETKREKVRENIKREKVLNFFLFIFLNFMYDIFSLQEMEEEKGEKSCAAASSPPPAACDYTTTPRPPADMLVNTTLMMTSS